MADKLTERMPHFRFETIENGDHHFFLCERKDTFRIVKEYLEKEVGLKSKKIEESKSE